MQIAPKDPLLAAARIVLIIAMGLTLAAAAGATIAFVAVSLMREAAWSSLAEPGILWGVLGAIALLAAAAILSFYFLRHLYRIVGTVSEGDPFVPANAERFGAMAWITLGVNLLVIAVGVIALWVPHNPHDHFDFNFAFGGLLLALVLFVIARVFREGTRMRDELEGTV